MFKRILVGYDGSASAKKALRAALALAKELEADLCCLSVEEGLPTYAGTTDEFQGVKTERATYYSRIQSEAQHLAAAYGLALDTAVVAGHPAQTIVAVAREGGYDLVVMGHTGHSDVWGIFMGTTAEKVARHLSCSVLIVR